MKKYLLILVGAISLLGVSTVKADTRIFKVNSFNGNYSYESNKSFYSSYEDILSKLYNDLLEYYNSDFKETYPYYRIFYSSSSSCVSNCSNLISISMYLYVDLPVLDFYNDSSYINNYPNYVLGYSYDISSDSYILPFTSISGSPYVTSVSSFFSSSSFNFSNYWFSNFDYIINLHDLDSITLDFSKTYNGSSIDNIVLYNGDILPSYQDHFDLNIISDSNIPSSSCTEVNLNNYSYVALSLKDYTEREEFYTNVEVQGQYCLTPVYDYGLKEKKDVISGSKNQACSPYYDNYTPVRTYILESDIKNHAIYYLKAYDISRDNKVKVDSSIFNIHYITSEEADNPILNINGRNYTTIPYDNLTDSATISEEEGYVSGVSCGVGDINCTHDVLGGHSITDIFNKPLEFFKNLIESFVSVFELVTSLIAVLPLPMQWFLYLSFTLAIALGIIKIIL